MSTDTWREEFLPAFPKKDEPEINHLKHCIVKWNGLLPKNLKKHGLKYKNHAISEEDTVTLLMNHNTCTLCYLHQGNCDNCCINAISGYECDSFDPDNDMIEESPWNASINTPEPMINLLNNVLKEMEKQ